jgi:FlaA1/EpsC-like NDP-sugar epimerase
MISLLKNRNFWIMLLGDTLLALLSYYFAYYLRFDGDIPPAYLTRFLYTIIWIVPIKLACFFFFDLYRGMWRYTSVYDLINLSKACLTSSATIAIVLIITIRFIGFPRSVFIIDFLLTFLFVGGFRMGIRLYYHRRNSSKAIPFLQTGDQNSKRLLIIGAGDGGEKLLREISENPNLHYEVAGLIDDNVSKLRQTIHGVPVLGTLNDMGEIAKKREVDEIIIAVQSTSEMEMKRMVNFCENTGLPYKILPALGELIEGKVTVSALREMRYEDLLGRKEVELDMEQIGDYLTDKRVMVTGGAGSIGSELCRQIARFNPAMLLIVDMNESGLYETEVNLLAKFPEMQIVSVLRMVHSKSVMDRVFRKHEPQVVFHAAAYKHVPMMEVNPCEAVFNNIIGTQAILFLCLANGVERCVIVSSDKAVRPTNVMGASKRVDEILTQVYARKYNRRFMAVRFGNVVGSVGSVVPLFQKQIERGGPLTVTHPEATRYFMTIPEASSLILQAGAMGKGGEIFILKMGTPIRIVEMARDIISLSSFKPGKEIEIRYIGLRPGEKLHEELITEGEGVMATEHEKILALRGNSCDHKELDAQIDELLTIARTYDANAIKRKLQEIVPEYTPQM